MAEIKIEKKKPVWPWVLLILGLAVLVYFLFFRDKETENEIIDEVEETTSVTNQKETRATASFFAVLQEQTA